MMLRTRQRKYVDKCNFALKERKNTLGVAPTGAGKTIMMAAVCLENKSKELPSLIMQHRDELVTQNRDKCVEYAGGLRNIRRPMTIDATSKAWDRAPGGLNFGMVQTLVRNLDAMPALSMLAIDEAHHTAADSYLQIIKHAKLLNPDVMIYGTTATPNRGDRKALRTVFDNCADQIQIGELIREGHLVRPRTFVLDLGVTDELSKVKKTASDFDMKEVESILNKTILTDKIIENWRGFYDKAGNWISCADRQTIIFCSTVQHAKDVTQRFQEHGIKAEMIDGTMALSTRREILKRYDVGDTQVLLNVSILTEGFDHQPTSCVILLRKESWKSTMTQMIGRGLRKVDPEIYPGVIKDDCIVLDFGTSCLIHGSLEEDVNLSGSGTKMCPECQSTVPQNARECVICGHEFPELPKVPSVAGMGGGGGDDDEKVNAVLSNFVMSEIDILQDSPFKYESFYHGRVMICFGFSYWAAVVHYKDHRYYAIGAEALNENANSYKLHILNSSDNYLMTLQSADDYMRTKGNKTDARKVAQWLYEPPTSKQMQVLGNEANQVNITGHIMGMTKYRASCGIQFKFYGNQIRNSIEGFIGATEEQQRKYA